MNAEQTNADVTALLKARHTLLWIVSREEMRVERALVDACAAAKYEVRLWDCFNGIQLADGKRMDNGTQDPGAALNFIRTNRQRCVYVLRDLHKWLDPVVLRTVRSLARELQSAAPNEARAIVVLTPSGEVPPELSSATVIEYPLPDRGEVARILDDVLSALPTSIRDTAAPDGVRDPAIDSAVGLTADGIANCYAKSLVSSKRIDPALVMASKKQAIKANGITVYDPDPRGLDAIGGYDVLKAWARQRALAFSKEARAYGLPSPKGALLLGPPGCVAEGTRISYRRGKRNSGRELTIEVLYEKFNGVANKAGWRRGAAWDSELPTYMQSWDATTGKVAYNEVLSVIDSGLKRCLRITTDHALSVELTADHPILTAEGRFVMAGDLTPNDKLLVRGSMRTDPSMNNGKRVRRERVVIENLKFYPCGWRKVVVDQDTGKRYEYRRTNRARLVVEARMNGVTLDELITILKEDAEHAEQLTYLPSEYEVHHLDEDPTNDAFDNLVVMTSEEHARHHGEADGQDHFHVEYTRVVKVAKIEVIGWRRTFDVQMANPRNNFVVNDGIIVHNTGKSLTAKAFGVAFQMPVLRLDLGGTKSKYVGESEQNIRGALKVAEAMAPCVLWLDEIEKALAGASGPAGDGGVSADALGTILSWMQEKTAAVFVVATANDIRALPPELLRKGRFDEMFFVDLPTTPERAEIVKAALAQYGRAADGIDVKLLADATAGFTGAEIAALVPDALFTAFADGARPLNTDDLSKAASTVVPLSKTAAERLNQLREWAQGRARMASTPETAATGDKRTLDL